MNISFVFKFKHYLLFLGLFPTEEVVIIDSLVNIMEKSGDFFQCLFHINLNIRVHGCIDFGGI